MTGILRTWHCLNGRCNRTFDAWEPNPICPECQCVRVSWVPGGGHIGSGARAADAELRALADVFRMDDMHSAEEGRAAKKVSLPDAPRPNQQNLKTFAGGFTAAIDPTVGAQCVPTANRMDFKVKASPGTRLSPNANYPGLASNTAVEATHRTAGGRT